MLYFDQISKGIPHFSLSPEAAIVPGLLEKDFNNDIVQDVLNDYQKAQ